MNRRNRVKSIEEFKLVFNLFDIDDRYTVYGKLIDLSKEKYSNISQLVKIVYKTCVRTINRIGKNNVVISPRINIIDNRYILVQIVFNNVNNLTVEENGDKTA